MSYCNSIFSTIINFITKEDNESNYIFSIKTLLYSIFNPGGGFLISSIVLFDSCKCDRDEKCDNHNLFLSIIALLLSLFLMICPYFICIGLFLIKICENNIEFYPIKFLFLFIGVIGTLLSFSFSYIKSSAVFAAYKEKVNPFDIVWKCGEAMTYIKSKFGLSSFIRILINLIIPGYGTMSLVCNYCCNNIIMPGSIIMGYLLVSVIEFFFGGMFLYLLFVLINNILSPNSELNVTIPFIFYRNYKSKLEITNYSTFEYIYSLTFFYYISGIFIILILDYSPNFLEKNKKNFIFISLLFLNLFTGGLGTILFADIIYYSNQDAHECWRYLCFCSFCCCCPAKYSKMFLIGFISIIVYSLAFYSLFFNDIFQINLISLISYIPILLFLIIYISTAIYFKYMLNKINYI